MYKMHPTPAVCGLPKKEAMEFVLKEEGYDRKFYSGFLGEWNRNEASMFVLICAKVPAFAV
uniref:chorismate-binding protein n=1 Tax=Flavobacterium sp. TaxID=239 RepID=UPI0040474081